MRGDRVFHWGVLVPLRVSPGAKLYNSRMSCELPDAETEFDGEFGEDREHSMEWLRCRTGSCGGSWIWDPCDLSVRIWLRCIIEELAWGKGRNRTCDLPSHIGPRGSH
jgi:hypothetical protein